VCLPEYTAAPWHSHITWAASVQVTVRREMKALPDNLCASTDGDVIVVLDLTADASLRSRATARELINRFQKLRKRAGLQPADAVDLFYEATASPANDCVAKCTQRNQLQEQLDSAVGTEHEALAMALGRCPIAAARRPPGSVLMAQDTSSLVLPTGETTGVVVSLAVPAPGIDRSAIATDFGDDAVPGIAAFVASKGLSSLQAACNGDGDKVGVTLDGHKRELLLGKHLFWSCYDVPQ
jgi:isoleucyl-tRNA synthetase